MLELLEQDGNKPVRVQLSAQDSTNWNDKGQLGIRLREKTRKHFQKLAAGQERDYIIQNIFGETLTVVNHDQQQSFLAQEDWK